MPHCLENNFLSKSKAMENFVLSKKLNSPVVPLWPLEGPGKSDLIKYLRNFASESIFRTWWILVLFLLCFICFCLGFFFGAYINTKIFLRNWNLGYLLTKDVHTLVRSL